MESTFVSSKDGYVITCERTVYWSRYLLWSPDGKLLQKNSAFSEIETARDQCITRDEQLGDDYD